MTTAEQPLLELNPELQATPEKSDNGEVSYHEVLEAVSCAVDLDAVLYDGGVDLNYQLLMTDLYSAGAIRATRLRPDAALPYGPQSFTKMEGLQDVEAFKVRGAFLACMLALKNDPNIRDFAANSAGNHGQGVAYFVQWFNARLIDADPSLALPHNKDRLAKAHIFCKEAASPDKVERMEARNATVYREGIPSLEKAAESATLFVTEQNQKQDGRSAYLVHPFNQPEVMAGQSLILLETLHQLREQGVDVRQKPLELYVAGGGFGLANGNAVLMDYLVGLNLLHPDSVVVAVQMEHCDAMNRALNRLDQGNENLDHLFIDESEKDTFDPSPDGTAVLEPGDRSLALARHLRRRNRLAVMTVSKAELGATMREDRVRNLRVEPAARLAEAGLRKREQALVPFYYNYPEWQQRITVAVESGGSSVSDATLREFYDAYHQEPASSAVILRSVGRQCVGGATAAHNSIL